MIEGKWNGRVEREAIPLFSVGKYDSGAPMETTIPHMNMNTSSYVEFAR